MRPVTGAVSLGLRVERGARRELGRRAEDAALATLDARDRRAIEAAIAPLQRLTAALAAPG